MNTNLVDLPTDITRAFGTGREEVSRNIALQLAVDMYRDGKWSTGKAAEVLGIKPATLKRAYGHPQKGFLREGKHWKAGMYANSPKAWCIEACRTELTDRGYVFFGEVEAIAN